MRGVFIPILLAISVVGFSQEFDNNLFSGTTGEALYDSIVANFKTDTVLTYSQARDTLFRNIYAQNDSLECMYSGWKRYLNPDLDPTQAVFTNNGSNEDINTEHVYPRSMGASEGTAAHSDMHHLFPTRVPVNTARGNDIFMDISDNQTDTWFYLDQTSNNIPNNNIEQWSEDISEGFEPREESKGDVARAVFYVYTMYRDQVLNASSQFFEQQRETLCVWAADDPATEEELIRTYGIAEYQDDKPNPFVIDCSLSQRMYCEGVTNVECITSTSDTELIEADWTMYPNPISQGELIIEAERNWTHVIIVDMLGQVIERKPITLGENSFRLNLENLPMAGNYQVILYNSKDYLQTAPKTLVRH